MSTLEESEKIWIETRNTKSVRYLVYSADRRRKMSLVVGESGSGKTRTMKQIAGEIPTFFAWNPTRKPFTTLF